MAETNPEKGTTNYFYQKIENCCDCKHSHIEKIYTPDSWEHESGIFCSITKTREGKDRLVVADEWNLRKWSRIPDWCPKLQKGKPN